MDVLWWPVALVVVTALLVGIFGGALIWLQRQVKRLPAVDKTELSLLFSQVTTILESLDTRVKLVETLLPKSMAELSAPLPDYSKEAPRLLRRGGWRGSECAEDSHRWEEQSVRAVDSPELAQPGFVDAIDTCAICGAVRARRLR